MHTIRLAACRRNTYRLTSRLTYGLPGKTKTMRITLQSSARTGTRSRRTRMSTRRGSYASGSRSSGSRSNSSRSSGSRRVWAPQCVLRAGVLGLGWMRWMRRGTRRNDTASLPTSAGQADDREHLICICSSHSTSLCLCACICNAQTP